MTIKKSNIKRAKSRRGSATVELAVVTPVLLLLIFGACDYGRSMGTSLQVTNAARIGAEYGATHRFSASTKTDWENQIRIAVASELASITNYDPQCSFLTIQTVLEDDEIHRVTVNLEYRFQTVISWPALPNTILIKQTITMRQIR